MGEERCDIGPNVAIKGSLENQCSMSSNTTTTTPITTTTNNTHPFSTNASNNNNNNNEEQDPFLPFTTTSNTHHFSTNASNNNSSSSNNNNEQYGFLPIATVTNNTHPFSINLSNNNSSNNKEQDCFLPISTNDNNTQHFSSNATNNSSSSSSNKEQDRNLPISASTNNTHHFPTNASHSNNATSNNKEQDRFLPIANVGRIMKKFIPGNGKISKDAKETVQECVSEFISFVTGEASDKCQREKRKTINGDDIIWAITTLGFEDYVTPLKQYLNKYRELEGEKLNVPKQQRLQQHDQKPNMSYHSVYSSTNLLSQPSFVPNDQPFPLAFSQNSVQAQLPQQEHIDSVGNW